MIVARYCKRLSDARPRAGDLLKVGPFEFGEHRDLVQAEYDRAKAEHPENPAYHMRQLFRSGGADGVEILKLAMIARPHMRAEIAAYLEAPE